MDIGVALRDRRPAQMLHQQLGRPRQRLEAARADHEPAGWPSCPESAPSRSASIARSVLRRLPAPPQLRHRRPPSGRSHRNRANGRGSAAASQAARHALRYEAAVQSSSSDRRSHIRRPPGNRSGGRPLNAPRRPVTNVSRSSLNRNRSTLPGSACSEAKPRSAAPVAIAPAISVAFPLLDIDIDIGMRPAGMSPALSADVPRVLTCWRSSSHIGLGAAGKGCEIAAHRLDMVDHDPGMIEQAFARRRQFDAAPAALQELDADSLFQPLDTRAGRWRAQGARRARRA